MICIHDCNMHLHTYIHTYIPQLACLAAYLLPPRACPSRGNPRPARTYRVALPWLPSATVCMYVCRCVCMYVCICMCVCMRMCVYVCMGGYPNARVYVHVHVCIAHVPALHIKTWVYAYIHKYMHTPDRARLQLNSPRLPTVSTYINTCVAATG
jgi:hypothetical protein